MQLLQSRRTPLCEKAIIQTQTCLCLYKENRNEMISKHYTTLYIVKGNSKLM
jgi:hypothetical protein